MYFARLSENFMSICDKYFHFVFNITGNTSSDFLQKLQISGKVFSPPEPSRAKFTPSGWVFHLSRPLAWTLQYNNIGLAHASNSLHWSVGKMNDDWNFFLIIKSTLRALLLNSDITLVKMPEALIIIPRYLNSWTVSNASLSNIKWCFFINLPLLLNIKIFVFSVLTFSFHFLQ